ncbi:DUF3990 domain-containing protein [Butyrivibrio sp. FCS006]|uniref:DUF3990 domain-containing protein n=1 Tax=Butyrivibrio sp. FCS006 TaxID=1280684 RepID=UPI00040D34C6|nr:DUF3990 domain-containing protein [Butyrivibrio sp. FCS006]
MIRVYHSGYEEIREPNVHRGRKNADLGQGFYTTDKREFACRWAREKTGSDIYVNTYELELDGLNIKKFERNEEWFRYVFSNRRSLPDYLSEYDVIMGPIANDTIFDTLGIMTSGYLSDDEAMKLLCVGPCYQQITLKTLKAAEHLRFVSSEILSGDDIEANKKIAEADGEQYLSEFARVMEELN